MKEDQEIELVDLESNSHGGRKPKKEKKFKYARGCYDPEKDLPAYVKAFNTTTGKYYKGK